MNNPIDAAQAIVSRKGSALMQSDLNDIRVISLEIPIEEWSDFMWLMEGVAQIVNDPSYEGDIKSIE